MYSKRHHDYYQQNTWQRARLERFEDRIRSFVADFSIVHRSIQSFVQRHSEANGAAQLTHDPVPDPFFEWRRYWRESRHL